MNANFIRLRKEFWRKIIHIIFHVGIAVILTATHIDHKLIKYVFLSLTIFFVVSDYYRINGGDIINQGVKALFGDVIRKWEYRRLSASSFSMISLSIVMFLFTREIGALASLYIGLADPLASITRAFSKRFEFPGIKSLEGGTSFVIASIIITILYARFATNAFDDVNIYIMSIIGALCGALAETLSVKTLDDNLTVPIASALGLWLVTLL